MKKRKKSKAKVPKTPAASSDDVAKYKKALQDIMQNAQHANGSQTETEYRFRCELIEDRARTALGLVK